MKLHSRTGDLFGNKMSVSGVCVCVCVCVCECAKALLWAEDVFCKVMSNEPNFVAVAAGRGKCRKKCLRLLLKMSMHRFL
jgi:hypothetical protein